MCRQASYYCLPRRSYVGVSRSFRKNAKRYIQKIISFKTPRKQNTQLPNHSLYAPKSKNGCIGKTRKLGAHGASNPNARMGRRLEENCEAPLLKRKTA